MRPLQLMGFWVYNKLSNVQRARVIIVNENNQILLVRHWGERKKWSIPGGGVNKREPPQCAAQRELREELGVDIDFDRFVYLATVQANYQAPIYLLHIQQSELPAQPYNRREISAVKWHDLNDQAPPLSTMARLAIGKLSK